MPSPFATQLGAFLLVVLAALLGGVIGWEREREQKPAGLRTHMLVCAAACLLTVLGRLMTADYIERFGEEVIRFDPTRVIQAIAVGVSFIGAGTIIQVESEHRVRYLTTAASILFVAGIGITVGAQEIYLAILTTLFAYFTMRAVGRWEQKMLKKREKEKVVS